MQTEEQTQVANSSNDSGNDNANNNNSNGNSGNSNSSNNSGNSGNSGSSNNNSNSGSSNSYSYGNSNGQIIPNSATVRLSLADVRGMSNDQLCIAKMRFGHVMAENLTINGYRIISINNLGIHLQQIPTIF